MGINSTYVKIELNQTPTTIEVRYLSLWQDPSHEAMQAVLGGINTEDTIAEYESQLDLYTREFTDLIKDIDPDIIAIPPSSNGFNKPFLATATSIFPEATIVNSINRKPEIKSRLSNNTQEKLNESLTFHQLPILQEKYDHLLFIDDLFAKGRTTIAILNFLSKHTKIKKVTVAVQTLICSFDIEYIDQNLCQKFLS